MQILEIVKKEKKLLFTFFKTYLKYMPRVDPINHRQTEHMRQSYVLYLCKNSFKQNLNVPEPKVLPDVCFH